MTNEQRGGWLKRMQKEAEAQKQQMDEAKSSGSKSMGPARGPR